MDVAYPRLSIWTGLQLAHAADECIFCHEGGDMLLSNDCGGLVIGLILGFFFVFSTCVCVFCNLSGLFCVYFFVCVGSCFLSTSQEIGWEERLQSNLFYAELGIKP